MSKDKHILDEILKAQKHGQARGIVSLCSTHPYVLSTAMMHADKTGEPVLIESTCNQVNQFGGYTGMTPSDFVRFIQRIAKDNGVPVDQVMLGGDHLGPNVWQHEPAESAMEKSHQMVKDYISAGYTKIHLDASMKCLDDDPQHPLPKSVSATRVAEMAYIAELTHRNMSSPGPRPRYVIGTEVPIPGGSLEHEDVICVTTPKDVVETIEITRQAFFDRKLESAWERVIAVVVQPGVEFGDDSLFVYDPAKAADLSRQIEQYDHLIYEAHSTDYQPKEALQNLVRDHFAILKVGPGLTFALREAVFALAMIEDEMFRRRMDVSRSLIREKLDAIMLEQPNYWERYYLGSPADRHFARKYSFSDRSRYYWPVPEVQSALEKLIHNLTDHQIPLSLISQYLPVQYERIKDQLLESQPEDIIRDKIASVLSNYLYACQVEIQAVP